MALKERDCEYLIWVENVFPVAGSAAREGAVNVRFTLRLQFLAGPLDLTITIPGNLAYRSRPGGVVDWMFARDAGNIHRATASQDLREMVKQLINHPSRCRDVVRLARCPTKVSPTYTDSEMLAEREILKAEQQALKENPALPSGQKASVLLRERDKVSVQ